MSHPCFFSPSAIKWNFTKVGLRRLLLDHAGVTSLPVGVVRSTRSAAGSGVLVARPCSGMCGSAPRAQIPAARPLCHPPRLQCLGQGQAHPCGRCFASTVPHQPGGPSGEEIQPYGGSLRKCCPRGRCLGFACPVASGKAGARHTGSRQGAGGFWCFLRAMVLSL